MKSSNVADEIRGRRPAVGAGVGEVRTGFRGTSVKLAVASVIIGGGLLGLIITMGPFSNHAAAQPVDPKAAPIDGNRAFGYLEKICAIGPRIAASEANTKQRVMVAQHFKAQGGVVREQPFAAQDPRTGKRVTMVNLVGSWRPELVERVLIGAHYDTRPFPDEEEDPQLRRARFIGANDGASGVALLMEIAHHLKDSQTPWGVDLVLFDGEELICKTNKGAGDFFLGSKAFAAAYKKFQRADRARPRRKPATLPKPRRPAGRSSSRERSTYTASCLTWWPARTW